MNIAADIPNPLPPGPSVLPHAWQMMPPDPATPLMSGFVDFHRLILCVLGVVFVAFIAMLVIILLRFRFSRHPRPQKGGGPFLQIAWVGLPAVLLVLLAIPALRLTGEANNIPKPDVTVEVIGENGGWTYAYPEEGDFRYESHRLPAKAAAEAGLPEGFATHAPLTVPLGQTVEVLLTSADVLHSWSVPALGVHGDAVPGRITRVWFKATKPGIYYGLCSSLCGTQAMEMPVAVQVVPEKQYRLWLSWALHTYSDGEDDTDKAVPEGDAT